MLHTQYSILPVYSFFQPEVFRQERMVLLLIILQLSLNTGFVLSGLKTLLSTLEALALILYQPCHLILT